MARDLAGEPFLLVLDLDLYRLDGGQGEGGESLGLVGVYVPCAKLFHRVEQGIAQPGHRALDFMLLAGMRVVLHLSLRAKVGELFRTPPLLLGSTALQRRATSQRPDRGPRIRRSGAPSRAVPDQRAIRISAYGPAGD